MGNDRGNYRRTVLELVLVTAIFAVVGVSILKIYLTADRLRGEAVALSTATVQAENVAEAVKLGGIEYAAERFGMEAGEGYYILHYDRHFEVASGKGKYQLVLLPAKEENGLWRAVVYVGGAALEDAVKSGAVPTEVLLCKLFVAVYFGQGR